MENMLDMLKEALEEYENELVQVKAQDDSEEIEVKVDEYRKVLREEYSAKRQKKIDELHVSAEAVRRLIDKVNKNVESIGSAADENTSI